MIEHFPLSLRSQPASPTGTDACFLEQFWLLLPGRGWDMLYWGHVCFCVCGSALPDVFWFCSGARDEDMGQPQVHHAMLPTAFAE